MSPTRINQGVTTTPVECSSSRPTLKQQSYMRRLAARSYTFTEGDVCCSRHASLYISRARSRSKGGQRSK